MTKCLLRKQLLHQRRSISRDAWNFVSNIAQARLMQMSEFTSARSIGLYAPIQNEIDTALIVKQAFLNGAKVLFPAVCGTSMVFRQIASIENLQQGVFGILEPCASGVEHQANELDLIVVPGVVFDQLGHRIGYGKGYYDRFLNHADLSTSLIGLCHDFQVVNRALPAEKHDIYLHKIVTDKRIICCRSNRCHNDGTDLYRGGI